MSDFGDADPEDSWDDSDPFSARLFLLTRILASIDADLDVNRAFRRRIELRRLLRKLADEVA